MPEAEERDAIKISEEAPFIKEGIFNKSLSIKDDSDKIRHSREGGNPVFSSRKLSGLDPPVKRLCHNCLGM